MKGDTAKRNRVKAREMEILISKRGIIERSKKGDKYAGADHVPQGGKIQGPEKKAEREKIM